MVCLFVCLCAFIKTGTVALTSKNDVGFKRDVYERLENELGTLVPGPSSIPGYQVKLYTLL